LQKVACIPAFNVENTIQSVIRDTSRFVENVIVCDDGSKDGTAKFAKEAGAIVIKHEKNLGKGAALRSLFNYARKINFDVLITIDGDGQFLANEIPKLISSIEKNESDIVIGTRNENSSEMPGYRKFGNKVLDKMTNAASELPFGDTQSGFRAYSRKAIDIIKFYSDGFAADSEILVSASKKGLKISEEKISVKYDIGTKTSSSNPVSHSTSVITKLIELVAVKSPLKYLGIPGVILFVFGLFYSGIVISIFNQSGYFSVPSTLVALGSLVIGMLFILTAIILFTINVTKRM
jgi:glycosyltransferase involved in cell wall biosynthesis